MTFVIARFNADATNTHVGDTAGRITLVPTLLQTTIIGAQLSVLSTSSTVITNYTALGYNTHSFADNNKVRIGNSSVTQAHVQVAWTVTSDQRLKTDIKDLDLGTDFVKKLRPVSYKRVDGDGTEEMGFIAQEVKSVLPRPLSLLSVDNQGTYGLRKDDFIAVLVKTVQELESRIADLEKKLESK
jgi:hypothetical protein